MVRAMKNMDQVLELFSDAANAGAGGTPAGAGSHVAGVMEKRRAGVGYATVEAIYVRET